MGEKEESGREGGGQKATGRKIDRHQALLWEPNSADSEGLSVRLHTLQGTKAYIVLRMMRYFLRYFTTFLYSQIHYRTSKVLSDA